jgi:hypothetical protein
MWAPGFEPRHIVALSGGKDSTAMALRLCEVEPETDFTFVCTPTGDEPDEMFAHWNRLSELLRKPILPIVHPLGLNGLIAEKGVLPNSLMRWCTRMLKIEPYARFLEQVKPCNSYVALRADENERPGGYFDDIPGVIQRRPLQEWGWHLSEVLAYLAQRDVSIPVRTDCDRCFFQTLWEWYTLWRDKPAKYAHAERQELDSGHTFRSPSRDTQPASLRELRLKFENGYIPKERRRDSVRAMQCQACTL